MAEIVARFSRRGPASEETLEAVHAALDELWTDAEFLSDLDRMAFTTAVIEASTNVIRHAQPDDGAELQLGVDVTVSAERLEARISEIGARHSDPAAEDAAMPEAGAENESGWGLALIQALVTTVTFEREGGSNVWVLRRNASNHSG
ncbi:ATP-binding protein [Arthrobacter mangrovi]|uniref:Histidine kinase/HSP90-like ATPase domain-containing protein n=1 Tax=Arthrobacter mangrovi TaxID=2966350 RepID=A0ABQ5MW51_9MICC|nr:ATP-binding protein [Arthrobacter mangrovi]GLB68174.1 hypothetical protein AHIS1636_26160 [Arthrobacter mangrovi]